MTPLEYDPSARGLSASSPSSLRRGTSTSLDPPFSASFRGKLYFASLLASSAAAARWWMPRHLQDREPGRRRAHMAAVLRWSEACTDGGCKVAQQPACPPPASSSRSLPAVAACGCHCPAHRMHPAGSTAEAAPCLRPPPPPTNTPTLHPPPTPNTSPPDLQVEALAVQLLERCQLGGLILGSKGAAAEGR